jgi:protein-disulfide isomerase
MAKKNTSSRATSGKSQNGKAQKKSSTLPLAILVVSVAGAIGIAMFLSQGEAEPTTTFDAPAQPVDMAGGGHTWGAPNPAVTLVEYGDYECPHCMEYHHILTEVMRQMPSELALEFHHYPIPVGPNSIKAAMAAEAAGEQGHYREMHDRLFETQREWTGRSDAPEIFTNMAGQMGLDTAKFREDMASPEISDRVINDRLRGNLLGVEGTPTFFVNGLQLDYVPATPDEFVAQLRSLMGQ